MLTLHETDLIQTYYKIDINNDPEGIDKLIDAVMKEQVIDELDNESEELTNES